MTIEAEKTSRKSEKSIRKKIEDLGDELGYLQRKSRELGIPVLIIVEGLSAAGKGTLINRIIQPLDPRGFKVSCIASPNSDEQLRPFLWRFWRRTPSADRMAIFDRSWYNRGGVEKVMGFCTQKQYVNFLQTCPEFERMVISSGTQIIKYWFSVSAKEQMSRFNARANDPTKGWKLSPMDLESVNRWDEYSKAKDNMFEHTDTQFSPWYVVESDNKKKARINCINHILNQIKYHSIEMPEVVMPDRVQQKDYERPPRSIYNYVKEVL